MDDEVSVDELKFRGCVGEFQETLDAMVVGEGHKMFMTTW